ncbi:F-box/kelch-repeat protein At3g06240-like [Rutidosis leptorrhynchoides]|uniref:F-box/kelch-repeat protein At3g06240-like n=1 Tax=Rutidosis leptorrhynchoides TaxID=125765 RepID=UPI003A98D525
MASKRTKTTVTATAATANAMASEFSITIPREMITEILYRLPAQSVGRFRCVSKDWLSELTSPQFIENHRKTLNRNHLIFVSCNDRSLNLVPLDHHRGTELTKCNLKERFFTIFGSCNGLVLVSFRVKGCMNPDSGGYLFKLLVLNPITREFIQLPDFGRYKLINVIRKHNISYGFGYDSLTDEYKLVTIAWRHDLSSDSMHIRVFSLTSNNTYARVTESLKDYRYIVNSPGVFVNGFLHWFAKKRSDGLGVILAFNLASENFNVVPSPDDVDIVANSQCKLVGIGGKLAIVLSNKGQVWLMNEYGVKDSWNNILIYGQHEFCTLLRPMFSVNKGYILRGPKFPVIRIKQTLIDDETKKRYYSDNAEFCQNLLLINQDSFTESLVSPNFSGIN